MRTVEDYDAVIVGASFAGLAAATQLQGAGRVLLADREPLGAGETAACGTLLAVLEVAPGAWSDTRITAEQCATGPAADRAGAERAAPGGSR